MNPAADSFRTALWLLPALLLPFLALARHLGSGMRPTERILIGAALAPIGLALPSLLLVLAVKAPFASSFWQSEFLWLVATLWPTRPALGHAQREPLPERGHGFPSLAVAAIGVGVLVVVLVPPIVSRLLALAGEPWFQTAVMTEIRRNGVPPQDPTFAGMPLFHPWLPPFFLALMQAATGASPFGVQVLLAGWAALVWTLAVAHIAYRAFGRAAAIAAAAIATLGFNPLGWVWWLVHPRENGGGAIDKLMELAGIENAGRALGPGFPAGDASMLLRFWAGAEQSVGLGLAAVLAWNVARGLERQAGRSWTRTACLALALVFWSPACAGPLAAALLGGWLFASAGAGGKSLGFVGVMALGGAWLVAWPYRLTCTLPGGAGAPALGWAAAHATMLGLGVGLLWITVLPALLLAWQHNAASRFALGAMLMTLVATVFSSARAGQLDVAAPMSWLWIAPLAAGGLVWCADRVRLPLAMRLSLAAALIVPTTGLLLIGAFGDGRSLGALVHGSDAAALVPQLRTNGEEQAYWMMREILPKDAVVIESPRPVTNEPVPVLAERRLFFPPHGVDRSQGYGREPSRDQTLGALREEFAVRQRIQLAIFGSDDIGQAQQLYLYTFASPIYVLARRAELSDAAWNGLRRRPEWGEILANPDVRLYRFDGQKP